MLKYVLQDMYLSIKMAIIEINLFFANTVQVQNIFSLNNTCNSVTLINYNSS